MFQKIDKARRLLEEVTTSIEVRGVQHELWSNAAKHIADAIVSCEYGAANIEAIAKYNKEVEARKI